MQCDEGARLYLEGVLALLMLSCARHDVDDCAWKPWQAEWPGVKCIWQQDHLVEVATCVVVQASAIQQRLVNVLHCLYDGIVLSLAAA